MAERDWARYVAEYHTAHPGITERAFAHARDPHLGTAHDWLARALAGPVGAVLDVACGSAPMHCRLPFDTYLGIDLSTAELDLARTRGRGPLAVADARRLPVAATTADTVVCAMGLMLVQPVEDAVREMFRVLRPGGRLAVLLPATGPLALSDIAPVLTLTVSLHGPGSMPQLLRARRIRHVLRDNGFEVDMVDRQRFPFPLRTSADAQLAVSALYTPGRGPRRLEAAHRRLSRRTGPRAEVGVPLMRVTAHRPG